MTQRYAFKTCTFCGNEFYGAARRLACDDLECQRKLIRRRELQKSYATKKHYQKHVVASRRRIDFEKVESEKKHNRKCVECGEPCWPNYFRCKDCSNKITNHYNVTEVFYE